MQPLTSLAVSLISAAAGLLFVARRQRRRLIRTFPDPAPVTVPDVLVAVVIAAAVTWPLMVALATITADSVGMFAAIHVAYFGLIATLPLLALGIALLARTTIRRTPAVAALCVAMLLPIPLGIYVSHIEPRWLRVDEVALTVSSDRIGTGPVRVGVISDIQTADVGPYELRAVDEMMALRPDVILIPGDVAQMRDDEYVRERPRLKEMLRRLDAPGGVFVVPGDTDRGPDRLSDLVDGTGVRLLVDETARVRVGDRELLIGGLALEYGYEGSDLVRAELEAEPDDGAITIQFSHRPDSVLELPPDSRVDLTVAGHTHGGQIILPFFGPPLTLSDVPRDIARGGLHELDGNWIYLSNGVGTERAGAPQMRLFNRPSVGVVELR